VIAQDYPITTPYGQVPGYPLNNGFHNGKDYGCPTGTPVVVNGVTIGLSGATGYVSGAHLHVGRWMGGKSTNFIGGVNFDNAVVTEVGSDATNGKFVRIQADGASWVYLHLSEQLVKVGQELKGDSNMPITVDNLYSLIRGLTRREPTQEEVTNKAYLEDPNLAIETFWNNGGKQSYENKDKEYKPLGKEVFVKE
jgi:murein DD-endopeptidase MepM/ murein hydrolase activator NlpD